MAWLSKTDWIASDKPVLATVLNNIGLDIRTWGGPVDAAGKNLINLGKLQIGATDAGSDSVRITDASGLGVYVAQAARVWLGTRSNSRLELGANGGVPGEANFGGLVIDPSNGNVGIGTTAPLAFLHVNGTGNNPSMILGENPNVNTTGQAGYGFVRFSDGSLYTDFKTVTGGKVYFRSGAGAEFGYARTWMTVEPSTGNVGIGTAAGPITSRLQVVGLATYANNAAAVAGGLGIGAVYIVTGSNPAQLAIVTA